jgi:hypothetical protein
VAAPEPCAVVVGTGRSISRAEGIGLALWRADENLVALLVLVVFWRVIFAPYVRGEVR